MLCKQLHFYLYYKNANIIILIVFVLYTKYRLYRTVVGTCQQGQITSYFSPYLDIQWYILGVNLYFWFNLQKCGFNCWSGWRQIFVRVEQNYIIFLSCNFYNQEKKTLVAYNDNDIPEFKQYNMLTNIFSYPLPGQWNTTMNCGICLI